PGQGAGALFQAGLSRWAAPAYLACLWALAGWLLGPWSALLLSLSLGAVLLWAVFFASRLGGLTGDVLGSSVEIAELAPPAAAAVGSMLGTIAQAGFCLGYGRLAFRVPWPVAFLVGIGVFGVTAVAFQGFSLALIWLFPVTIVVLGVVIRLMPKGEDARRAA